MRFRVTQDKIQSIVHWRKGTLGGSLIQHITNSSSCIDLSRKGRCVCVCVEPYLIEVVFMTNILKEVSYPPERVLRL